MKPSLHAFLPRRIVEVARALSASKTRPLNGVQSLTAAQQIDDLIARTGDWRHPDNADEALGLARALMAHKRLPDALSVLQAANSPTVSAQRARIYIGLGDAPNAADAFAKAKDGISHVQAKALEISICALESGDQAACSLAEQAVMQYPDDPTLEDIWLGLLSHTDIHGDIFATKVASALSKQKPYGRLWRLFIKTMIRRNIGIWVLPQLLARVEQAPKDGFAVQSAIEVAWKTQDAAVLRRLIKATAALPQVPYKLAKQAAERADVFPPFADVDVIVWEQTEQLNRGVGDTSLARLGGLVGRKEAALDVVNDLLAQRPYLVDARFARAELREATGDYVGALADVENLMDSAPQLPSPYGLAFSLLRRQGAPEKELTALLDRRARYTKRFRSDPVTGRAPLDMLRYQTALARGDRAAAAEARASRPSRQLLHAYVGTSDEGLDRQVLGPGHTLDRIGVIAWLGIGDEVRWAQTYGLLRQLARQSTVSCEPRMQTLFERSFPDITFVPVRRRWPLRWQARPVLRSNIRDIGLSACMNSTSLRALAGSDAVVFPEEIVAQLLRHNPATWDDYTAELKNGYLKPDLAMRTRWCSQLKKKGRPLVGLIWRSGLVSPQRQPHYMTLKEMIPLVQDQAVDAVALVPHLTEDERRLCQSHDIVLPQNMDFDNDIEGMAALAAAIDLVVGISALPFELAAGVGTPTWAMVLTPDAVARRCQVDDLTQDQMTLNGRVIVPADGFDFTDRSALVTAIIEAGRDQLQGWIATSEHLG